MQRLLNQVPINNIITDASFFGDAHVSCLSTIGVSHPKVCPTRALSSMKVQDFSIVFAPDDDMRCSMVMFVIVEPDVAAFVCKGLLYYHDNDWAIKRFTVADIFVPTYVI